MKFFCLIGQQLLGIIVISGCVGVLRAEAVSNGPSWRTLREADDVWLLSSRHLPSRTGNSVAADALRVSLLDGNGRIRCCESTVVRSSAAAAGRSAADHVASLPKISMAGTPHVMCVFVHGNRISATEAPRRGLTLYNALRRSRGQAEPFRFVIWSWPTDRIRGPLRDGRAKLARSNAEAFYLASFLASLPADQRISLVGFSLGARVITGAMHLVAGGVLYGHSLAVDVRPRPRPRVALLAAAVENHWLLPGRPHGLAISQMDRLLLLNNSRDHALRVFHIVTKRRGTLGHTGLPCREQLGDSRNRVRQCDLSGSLGRRHALASYVGSRAIVSQLSGHLLP